MVRGGNPGDRFYVIVRERVDVERKSYTGPERLAVLSDGAHFGEIALLQNTPRIRRLNLCLALSADPCSPKQRECLPDREVNT